MVQTPTQKNGHFFGRGSRALKYKDLGYVSDRIYFDIIMISSICFELNFYAAGSTDGEKFKGSRTVKGFSTFVLIKSTQIIFLFW